ncbi:RDD family protein, partial [Pantoea sp. B9002]
TLPEAVPRTPVFALRLNEQRALLSFAERQGELSAERVDELAGLLAPALRVPPSLAVTELNGIARGLLGPT